MQKRGTMRKYSSSSPFRLCQAACASIARALAGRNYLKHRCACDTWLDVGYYAIASALSQAISASEEKLPGRTEVEQKSSIAPRRRTNVRREEASEDRKGNTMGLAESRRLSTLKTNQATKMQKRGTMRKHSSSSPFRLCQAACASIARALAGRNCLKHRCACDTGST